MLVNALSVVKSFYSNLLNKKKGKNNKRLFSIHSHFRKYSPLHFMTRAGTALVRTITSREYVWYNQKKSRDAGAGAAKDLWVTYMIG